MHKELFIVIAAGLMPISATACDAELTNLTLDMTTNAYNALVVTPNVETATEFFDMLPSTFCDFNMQYGYIDEKPRPLYELNLYSALSHLNAFLDSNDLSAKYVSIAAESHWNVDNVNALQHHFRNLFLAEPSTVITDILDLPMANRRTAVRFLFDGYYPRNNFLDESLKTEICEIDAAFCLLLSSVEEELTAEVP